MRASLLIPAAGSGTRFGGEVPKQLLPLAGEAILARSVRAFVGLVDECIVATSAALVAPVTAMFAQARMAMPVRVIVGGAERRDSVHAALLASAATSEVVLVHDAVRPLVPRACIVACLAALADHDGAVVAVPCAQTVKRAGPGDVVDATVPRDGLWLAQTPQGLRRAIALAAFARAAAERWAVSDDVQVLERAGHRVALVRGDARNLKITTPDDLALAEAMIAAG